VRCSDCNHKIPAHCIRVERLGKSCGDIAKHATSIVIHHTRIVKTENQRKHINNSHSLAKLWLENRAQMTLKDLIIAEKKSVQFSCFCTNQRPAFIADCVQSGMETII